jgi:hypothetical protein
LSFFTVEEAAKLAATTVRLAMLVDLMFDGQPTYIWNGFGQRTFAGKTYIGCGDLGSIEGLEETRGPTSHQVTLTLSAVNDSAADLLARVLEESDTVQGRLAIISVQLFTADWAAFNDPIPIFFGLMQPPRVARESATDDQGARRVIQLGVENLFYRRGRIPAGRYTDREQQSRHPSDRFCEYTPQLTNKVLNWPDYGWLLVISSSCALAAASIL